MLLKHDLSLKQALHSETLCLVEANLSEISYFWSDHRNCELRLSNY